MFEIAKTLIVVYKDEMLMNQLKKMVETNDISNKVLSLAFYKALYSLHIFVYFMFLKCNSILLVFLLI